METVYEALFKTEMVDEEQEKKKVKMGKDSIASITKPVGHSIQDCQDFLDLVQGLMDEGRIDFAKKWKGKLWISYKGKPRNQ